MSGGASRRALIIGYGSPIRGDDAIGPLVADRLRASGVPAGVTVLSRHVLTAELVPDIAASNLVVFLDAAADSEPGEVRCQRLAPDPSAASTMAHFLDPRELLAWAETLYSARPIAYMVSAGGVSFGFASYELTPLAAAAAESMMDRVRGLLSLDDWGPSAVAPERRVNART